MKTYTYIFLLLSFFWISCGVSEDTPETASEIINKAIEKACNANCDKAKIYFTFRNNEYISTRNGGKYTYERIVTTDSTTTKDVLTNDSFTRFVNNNEITVHDTMIPKYSSSVNSVHYFAQVPYVLSDPAVNMDNKGIDTIKGKPYYEIEVTFDEEGGGEDHDDIFIYWVNSDNYSVDYLAYSYATNGGGVRFREAFNERILNGIKMVDYKNYKPATLDVDLTKLDDMWEAGQLKLLSKIENEDVKIEIIK